MSSTDHSRLLFGTITDCPKSLQFIVQVYRAFGCSFSCVIFQSKGSSRLSLTQKFTAFLGLCLQVFFFSFTIFMAANHTSVLTIDRYPFTESLPMALKRLQEASRAFLAEFQQFKPILRTMLNLVFFVFTFENLLNYPLNLFAGYRLLKRLTTIPHIRHLDTDRYLALKLLVLVFGYNLSAFWCAMAYFYHNRWHAFFDGTADAAIMAGTYPFLVGLQSLGTILYLYTVQVLQRSIAMIRSSLKSRRLDEPTLRRLKAHLTGLSEHFHGILSSLAVQLTWSLIGSVYLTISTVCYFILVKQSSRGFYAAAIFAYAALALGRIVVVCCAGNVLTNEYQRLIEQVYQSVECWHLESWMLFRDIKKAKRRFKTTIWGLYSVNQKAMLAMLAFALGYIVVLLQTESYTKNA